MCVYIFFEKLERTHHHITQHILRSKVDRHTFYQLLDTEWEPWEKTIFHSYLEKKGMAEREIILDEAYEIICW